MSHCRFQWPLARFTRAQGGLLSRQSIAGARGLALVRDLGLGSTLTLWRCAAKVISFCFLLFFRYVMWPTLHAFVINFISSSTWRFLTFIMTITSSHGAVLCPWNCYGVDLIRRLGDGGFECCCCCRRRRICDNDDDDESCGACVSLQCCSLLMPTVTTDSVAGYFCCKKSPSACPKVAQSIANVSPNCSSRPQACAVICAKKSDD